MFYSIMDLNDLWLRLRLMQSLPSRCKVPVTRLLFVSHAKMKNGRYDEYQKRGNIHQSQSDFMKIKKYESQCKIQKQLYEEKPYENLTGSGKLVDSRSWKMIFPSGYKAVSIQSQITIRWIKTGFKKPGEPTTDI